MRLLLVLLFTLFLPACATITRGTTQAVTIDTDPSGATCTLERNGAQVGIVRSTPEAVRVDRSSHPINVRCTHDGYVPAAAASASRFDAGSRGGYFFASGRNSGDVAAAAGGVLVAQLAGIAVDAMSGAGYSYPETVRLAMAPLPGASVMAAVPAPAAPQPMIVEAAVAMAPVTSLATGQASGLAPAVASYLPPSTQQLPTVPAILPVVANLNMPPHCPAPGLRATRSDGTAVVYEGADPADPGLCIARVAGVRRRAPFGLALYGDRASWHAAGAVTAYLEGQPRPALRFEQVLESRARDTLARTTLWVDQETGVVLRQMTQLERGVLPGGTAPDWSVVSIDATGSARL